MEKGKRGSVSCGRPRAPTRRGAARGSGGIDCRVRDRAKKRLLARAVEKVTAVVQLRGSAAIGRVVYVSRNDGKAGAPESLGVGLGVLPHARRASSVDARWVAGGTLRR